MFVLMLAVSAGTVVAVAPLFTQTIPSVPVVEGLLITNCDSLTLTPTPDPVIPGDSGFVLGQCSAPPSAIPAFRSTGALGTVTPSFNLPAPYVQLAIIQHTEGSSCDLASPGYFVLVSGLSIPTMPEGNYDYCAAFVNDSAEDLPEFSVTWTQNPF